MSAAPPRRRGTPPRRGINRVGGLYLPYTEATRPAGPRGGWRAVMNYWGHGYASWDDARRALARGPDAPLSSAVAVDRVTGLPWGPSEGRS